MELLPIKKIEHPSNLSSQQLELQKFSDKLKAKTSVDEHQAIVFEILMEIIPVRLVWMHIKQKYLNFFWKLLQLSNGFFE